MLCPECGLEHKTRKEAEHCSLRVKGLPRQHPQLAARAREMQEYLSCLDQLEWEERIYNVRITNNTAEGYQ